MEGGPMKFSFQKFLRNVVMRCFFVQNLVSFEVQIVNLEVHQARLNTFVNLVKISKKVRGRPYRSLLSTSCGPQYVSVIQKIFYTEFIMLNNYILTTDLQKILLVLWRNLLKKGKLNTLDFLNVPQKLFDVLIKFILLLRFK